MNNFNNYKILTKIKIIIMIYLLFLLAMITNQETNTLKKNIDIEIKSVKTKGN